MAMFDAEDFVAECLIALREGEPIVALKEIVSRAISTPAALNARFPLPLDPDDDGILYRSGELTVTSAIFPRGFSTGIHNHTVAAVIGVWTGSEENFLYEQSVRGVTLTDAIRVEQGQLLTLTSNAIHDVQIRPSSWSGALHVYLGDIVGISRSEWPVAIADAEMFDGEGLHERWFTAANATGLIAEV